MKRKYSFIGVLLFVGASAFAGQTATVSELTLTGSEAQSLYSSLPASQGVSKTASLTLIQEYDQPGPFDYYASYNPSEDGSGSLIPLWQGSTRKGPAESLFLFLLGDGNGFPTTDNSPLDTQTIIHAKVLCAPPSAGAADYSCKFTP